MLTISEVLGDAAAQPEFAGLAKVGVNSRGANGYTPLHWMAILGDVQGVSLLLEAGAAIDAADNEGNTPLHEAVRSRQHLVVRLLVDRGANKTLRNAPGYTAVELARRDGYAPTAEALSDTDKFDR